MKWPYESFKKLAFKIDPEVVHNTSLSLMSKFPNLLGDIFSPFETEEKYKTNLKNMCWDFPVGLAAGLDKNGEALDFFSRLPFGAIEVGTVTPLPQAGNDKPRMFRLLQEESLLNRMGFNNNGADCLLNNINTRKFKNKVLGVNLGKNKLTDSERAFEDYQILYSKFSEYSDYLVINVSSPNTPGLRDLQNINSLKTIFESLKDLREQKPSALYLKISPDLAVEDIEGIMKLSYEYNLAGVIATNTTIMPEKGQGGISGKLLLERSSLIRSKVLEINKSMGNRLDIIGVGGISKAEDLFDFWKKGGRAIQVYSSFIFQGPEILKLFKDRIDEVLSKNELQSLEDLFKNIDKVKF